MLSSIFCKHREAPPATRESVPFAEYQEWPSKAFLNAQGSGMRQHYNIEFKLLCMSKLFSLPIEACDDEDAPTTPPTRSKAA